MGIYIRQVPPSSRVTCKVTVPVTDSRYLINLKCESEVLNLESPFSLCTLILNSVARLLFGVFTTISFPLGNKYFIAYPSALFVILHFCHANFIPWFSISKHLGLDLQLKSVFHWSLVSRDIRKSILYL